MSTVHILAAVRNPALLEAALLVFRTVRTGFPEAAVRVWGNALEWYALEEVKRAAEKAGCDFSPLAGPVTHDGWLERLLLMETRPFWVCDTDVVFFGRLEPAADDELAGRLEPEFLDESTGTRHVERLHPAVMYADPTRLRPRMQSWMQQFPRLWATAQVNLVRQCFIPERGQRAVFYDTCAGLWQAGFGRAFTDAENECFEHLCAGSYADLLTGCPGLKDLQKVHRAVFEDPSRARGMRARQERYYAERALRD